MKAACLAVALSIALFLPQPAAAAGEGEAGHYPETAGIERIHADLSGARRAAVDQGKLLMVVMGANWCHDSLAFVDYLEDPAFSSLADERYVVQKVNVGYYEHARRVIGHWDVPVIYGTPTVLVIEPVSDTLLNRDSLSTWRNAASLSPADAVAYFDDFAPGPPPERQPVSPALTEAFAEIDAFERDQAERIYRAYAEIGILLRGLGDETPGPEFMEKWDNLASMRSAITADLAGLRAEARAQDAAGASDIRLVYPEYALFID